MQRGSKLSKYGLFYHGLNWIKLDYTNYTD
jgi:hypothetical protein